MRLTVNGEPRDVRSGLTLADLVREVTGATGGIAAAVNGEVVPRRAWLSTTLAAADRIEIVTAVQGG